MTEGLASLILSLRRRFTLRCAPALHDSITAHDKGKDCPSTSPFDKVSKVFM